MNLNANINANMIKLSFIARAKTLAHVMTRTSNVKVTVQGNQAFNTNGLINIPAGDFTDPEWIKMVTGWIDHELGHEKHTNDYDYQSFAKQGKLHHHLINVVEDVWMERAVGNEFPGARQNLAVLTELAIKRDLFKNPENTKHPLEAVSAFLLYGGRAKIIGQHSLDNYADIAFSEVVKHFGQAFAQKLAAIRDDIEAVHSTHGAAKIAQAVIDLLQEEKDKQQQQQQQDADADSDDNQSGEPDEDADADSDDNQSGESDDDADADSDDNQAGESDDDADADSDDNQSGESDEDADADSDDNQSGESDDDADADSDDNQSGESDEDAYADSDDNQSGESDEDADADSDDNQAGEPDSNQSDLTPQQILEALERALEQADEAEIHDFHEALAALLGENAEQAKDEDEQIAQIAAIMDNDMVQGGRNQYLCGSNLDSNLAKQISGSVYQTMHKVLFDQVHALEISRRVGTKLVNRKLSGIPAGNLSVFSRRAETQDVSAAITVVTDASASMSTRSSTGNSTKMESANACAYAFALGLDKSGVASEFIYYGAYGDTNYETFVAKKFDEKPKASNFNVEACGPGTPTGPAIQFAINSLILRKEKNKMLIVLTDGDPDNQLSVIQAVQVAKAFGIKVIPIGIMTQNVKGFEKDEFVVVQNATELAPALRNAVRMKLFS